MQASSMLRASAARTATPASTSAPAAACRWRPVSSCRRVVVRATGTEPDKASAEVTSSREEGTVSSGDDDMRRVAALKRQGTAQSIAPDSTPGGLVQGALEEMGLITWPTLGRAASDTLLVLLIVGGSGALLFGCNVALAEMSEWWYHR